MCDSHENLIVSVKSKVSDMRMIQQFSSLPSIKSIIQQREMINQKKIQHNRPNCVCRDILVIDNDEGTVDAINEAAIRVGQFGVDSVINGS